MPFKTFSNLGPMPEILQEGGVYFDPENPASIAAALERLIVNGGLRHSVATTARQLSDQYSWERCARETWAYLIEMAARHREQEIRLSSHP